MRATDAYADLRRFGKPVLTTEDAALRLRMSVPAASKLLVRLSAAGLVLPVRPGLWSLEPNIDPLALPEYLTAPSPAYVSFQSALYFHGMISQIPQVIYVASLGRPAKITTAIGTFSIHRLSPEFFGGYTTKGDPPVHIATPEKALLDVLYLSRARSRLFSHLPEVELPEDFDEKEAQKWIARIRAPYQRTMVRERLEKVLARAGAPPGEGV